MNAKIKSYEEKKKERDQILKEAAQIKEQIIEEARNEAKKEADKITSSARENIIFEKNKAIEELKEKVSELSIDIAEKILQSELSDKKKSEQIIEREMEKIQL